MTAIEPGYDVETLVPDWQAHVARMGNESARVRERLPGRLDIAYGPDPLQKLDVFAPANAPTAPGTPTRSTTRQSTLPKRQWDRPDASVVPISARWTVAEAAAGLVPMASSSVVDVTP